MGDRIRADHGYRLYSSLIDKMPILKSIEWQLIKVSGSISKEWLYFNPDSYLGVRCSTENMDLFNIENSILRVGNGFLEIKTMEGETLQPRRNLSGFVTIKAQEHEQITPFRFGVALGKQLQNLGIGAKPHLGKASTLQIKTNQIIGFNVRFPSISDSESLILQRYGLGGRRKMSAGVFT